MGELACGVVVSCLLAALPPLTLDGHELSPVVEVWSLQEPAVEPEPAADEQAAGGFVERHPILTGAIFGAVGGCIYGAAVGSSTSDLKASDFCMANALVWSGIIAGTVAFARWYRDAAP